MSAITESYNYSPVRIRTFNWSGKDNPDGIAAGSRLNFSPEGMPESSQGFIPAGSLVLNCVIRINSQPAKSNIMISIGNLSDPGAYYSSFSISRTGHYSIPGYRPASDDGTREEVRDKRFLFIRPSRNNNDSTTGITVHSGMTREEYEPLDIDITFYIISPTPSTD